MATASSLPSSKATHSTPESGKTTTVPPRAGNERFPAPGVVREYFACDLVGENDTLRSAYLLGDVDTFGYSHEPRKSFPFQPQADAMRFWPVAADWTPWLPRDDSNSRDFLRIAEYQDAERAFPKPAHPLDVPPQCNVGGEFIWEARELTTREEGLALIAEYNREAMADRQAKWWVLIELGVAPPYHLASLDQITGRAGRIDMSIEIPTRVVIPTDEEREAFAGMKGGAA